MIFTWIALGVLSLISISLFVLNLRLRGKLRTVALKRQAGVLEDLELATSEQLLQQLRHRNGPPYLMLLPIKGDEHMGLMVEVHNLDPMNTISMLRMAAEITAEELKSRGFEIPGKEE